MIPGNNIGAEGVKALAPALGHLTQLKKLHVFGEYRDGCECTSWGYMCVRYLLVVECIQAGVRVWLGRYCASVVVAL